MRTWDVAIESAFKAVVVWAIENGWSPARIREAVERVILREAPACVTSYSTVPDPEDTKIGPA